MAISVPDTAFVIACYRANHQKESCDPFAKLWVKPGLQDWVDDFARKVSKYDEILHCMRNRYFHETLSTLGKKNEKVVCLNLGAGFSMYPYNLPDQIVSVEADLPDVIAHKKKAISNFQMDGLLSNRSVTYIPADITNIDDQKILRKIMDEYQGYRKVIMIEGVFFFLNMTQIQNVINFCTKTLEPGDALLTVSFDADMATTEVFGRLKAYFANELHSVGNNTTIPHEFYKTLPGFTLNGINSTLELARELDLIPAEIKEREVLNEYCYYLVRS